MKQVNIMRGDSVAGTITLIDPELRVVVVEEVKVERVKADQENELPTRMLYKGQRVRNLQPDDTYVKQGATGTVNENGETVWVIWDSPDMLTARGQCEDRRWMQESKYLEVIEEVKEEPKRTTTWANATSRKPDYSHLIGKWVKCYSDPTLKYRESDPGKVVNFPVGKWFHVSEQHPNGYLVVDGPAPYSEGLSFFCSNAELFFDLSNPRDTNPDDLPDEVKIPFDYERWKAGDFIRVETEDGKAVEKLTDFEVGNYPLHGVYCGIVTNWMKGGYIAAKELSPTNLTLIVKNPDKP